MALFILIAEGSPFVLGVVLVLLQLIVHEIGLWLGRRDPVHDRTQVETVGVVVGAMLALLAFVLALTLSFANTHFNERREGSLVEANALGTAWLRAKAVGSPESANIAASLEDYAQIRTDFIRGDRDQIAVDELNQKTAALQSKIWGDLTLIVRAEPNPITNSLMTALNSLFDASTAERFAFEMRLPSQLFWLLIAMTLLSMACLGYQFGLRSKTERILVALLVVMWTSVIVITLDLASPRLGQFRTKATVYDWTVQGFGDGTAPIATQP